MESVVGIRLRKTSKVYEFTYGDLALCHGEWVVVETEKGIVLGQVVYGPLQREAIPPEVKRVIRKADVEDLSILERNRRKEEDAYLHCLQKIAERKLPMKLCDVEYILSGGKAIFYFTAEGRVDFRMLVKDLASQFHTRIEMRQIGVRDESKMLGGIGPCGRELCCSSFLKGFEPVSIRMAKDQNLALNPQKVSGLCGRLMCCLTYEQATYEALWDQIPKIGKRVATPKGEGKIMSVDIKNHKVRTLIGDLVEIFTIEEIRELNKDLVRSDNERAAQRQRQRGDRRGGGGRRDDRGPAGAGLHKDGAGDRGPHPHGQGAGQGGPRDNHGPRPQSQGGPRDQRSQADRPPQGDHPRDQGAPPPKQDAAPASAPQQQAVPAPEAPKEAPRPPEPAASPTAPDGGEKKG